MQKENGHLIWKSIEEGPTPLPTIVVDGKTIKKPLNGYTFEGKSQYFADIEAQHSLVHSLTNEVYKKLDSYQDSSKEIWDQLEKIILGSKVGN